VRQSERGEKMENRKLQWQNENGDWNNATDPQKLIATTENFINNHPNREKLLKGQLSVTAALEAGQTVKKSADWYANIRFEPIAKPIEKSIELKKCSCGHTVPKQSAMSTSTGSSCPDCYDRMSI
jgi:hypothetical protein